MLTETLSEGLESYRIGPKIRDLRTEKKLGLTQLGDHTGLSAGMLSKIERGQVFPTLPTLLRISMVFGVGLEHFFDEGDAPVVEVIRARDRLRLPNVSDKMPSYFFESLDFPVNDRPIESYLAEFVPRTPATDPHEHSGVELVFVISGEVGLIIHDKTHLLKEGDSMYFDAGFPHSYLASQTERGRAIVVVASDA